MKGVQFNLDVGKGGIELRERFHKRGNYFVEEKRVIPEEKEKECLPMTKQQIAQRYKPGAFGKPQMLEDLQVAHDEAWESC